MSDSTSTLTGAGYQPDGEGAQQAHTETKPEETKTEETKTEETKPKENGEDTKEATGNPLTALVQSRQESRTAADQYQAQIAAMQQEIANLKAQQPKGEQPSEWKNPYDATEHPVDHLRAELEHQKAKVATLEQEGNRRLTEAEGVNALNQFEQTVLQEVGIAAQQIPELVPAYGYVQNYVTKMYEGQGLTGQRLSSAVRNHMLQSFMNGQMSGNSHAQTTAQMALNMGFKSETPKGTPDPVVRGQKAASQSIGQATGTGGDTTPPSAQQLASMPKDELVKDNRAGINRIREILKGNIPID